MEILNQFGFDIRLFAAQIINFLIIVFLLKKFLYKPLLKTLTDRERKISQGLIDAEKAKAALEEAENQKDEILAKAGKEAEKILSESKQQAAEVREKLINQTKEDIAHLMDQTKEQIALERENFKKEANNMSLEIAQKILETTIHQLFDKKDDEALIKKGLQKIKNA